MIPIYEPSIKIDKAIEALKSGWISNYGIFIDQAKELLLKVQKTKYCILMSNGTVATECCLLALKFKYPHLEHIYISDYCFISPYHSALRHFDLNKIHICPIDFQTLNIDTTDEVLNKLLPNSCLFVVHSCSGIVNVNYIKKKRPDLIIIEDNCEGFLGQYESEDGTKIPTGSSPHTLCSAVSFYANKNITSGEGGAFFTNDQDIYNYIMKVYSHGMTTTRYVHDTLAWNFRMTNIQAALLVDQLENSKQIKDKKKECFDLYKKETSLYPDTLNNIEFVNIPEGCESSYWMMVCKIKKIILYPQFTYKELEEKCKRFGFEIRPMFVSVSKHEHCKDLHHIHATDSLPRDLHDEYLVFMLPSGPLLKSEDIKMIMNSLHIILFDAIKVEFRGNTN